MKHVLLAGADLTIANSDGITALHFATRLEDAAIVQSMLEHGAPVDQQTANGGTALHLAVRKQRKSTMLLLLKAGAFAAAWHC